MSASEWGQTLRYCLFMIISSLVTMRVAWHSSFFLWRLRLKMDVWRDQSWWYFQTQTERSRLCQFNNSLSFGEAEGLRLKRTAYVAALELHIQQLPHYPKGRFSKLQWNCKFWIHPSRTDISRSLNIRIKQNPDINKDFIWHNLSWHGKICSHFISSFRI